MSLKVQSLVHEVSAVQCELITSEGNRFYVLVDQSGFSFYDRTSSSGTLQGSPVRRSADDIFQWIGLDGEMKPFAERKAVQVRKVKP